MEPDGLGGWEQSGAGWVNECECHGRDAFCGRPHNSATSLTVPMMSKEQFSPILLEDAQQETSFYGNTSRD